MHLKEIKRVWKTHNSPCPLAGVKAIRQMAYTAQMTIAKQKFAEPSVHEGQQAGCEFIPAIKINRNSF